MFSTFVTLLSLVTLATSAPVLQSRANTGGQATFFKVGLGNCGNWNSPSDKIVAISTLRYGSTNQVSSYCGKWISITNLKTGKSSSAQIQDSCPTCPNQNDLDMSTGLFSALGGTADEGVFPISWTMDGGDDSSSNESKPSKASSGSSNNNNDNNRQQKQSSSTPSATPAPTTSSVKKTTPSTSTSSTSTSAAPPSFTKIAGAIYNTTTGVTNATVSALPMWWAEIDNSGCGKNFTVAKGQFPVALAYNTTLALNGTALSALNATSYGNTTVAHNATQATLLQSLCGKWVELKNVANNKTINATIASWLPEASQNTVALADAYTALADIEDNYPAPILNVTYHFV